MIEEQLILAKKEYEEKVRIAKEEYDLIAKQLKKKLTPIKNTLRNRKYYEEEFGEVKEPSKPKTKEELREYNKMMMRKWRAKRRKEMQV